MLRSQHAQALPATLRQHCRPCLLASATALFTAAPSFYEALWPLAWVALVPLFVALREASPKRALLLGWWAETLMYWMGFYWLIGTMVRFGFIAVPLSVCFFAIIGLGNGMRLGLWAWWLRWTERSTHPWWVRLLLPACTYVAFDYLAWVARYIKENPVASRQHDALAADLEAARAEAVRLSKALTEARKPMTRPSK